MLAVGCLIPFVMLAAGAVLGSYLGDIHGGYWGAGIGFGAGLRRFRRCNGGDNFIENGHEVSFGAGCAG